MSPSFMRTRDDAWGQRAAIGCCVRPGSSACSNSVRSSHPTALIALVQMEALPNYGRRYGTAFHDLYGRLARETGVALLPFLLDGVAGRAELNQGDGIHPNMEGEHRVAATVWSGLEPLLKGRLTP